MKICSDFFAEILLCLRLILFNRTGAVYMCKKSIQLAVIDPKSIHYVTIYVSCYYF